MGYKKNPFNSPQGQKLMKDIFNLMFISPETKPSQIENENSERQITHYKGNIINIVNKMRKFVVGYEQVPLVEAASSGICVCPHCARRDPIWLWETVDAGHYNAPLSWTSSVSPETWRQGFSNEKGKYLWIVRYRCNDATTCKKCYTSWTGHNKNACPNCNSTDLAKVGCGEESFDTHYINPMTADQNHPQNKFDAAGSADNDKWRKGKQELMGEFSRYKFVHNKVPKGKIVNSWEDIKKYTPFVEFTYTNKEANETMTREYPISELNYAISKQQQKMCFNGIDRGNDRGFYHPMKTVILKTGTNRPTESCPRCGATDYPPLIDIQNQYYRPDTMRIMNPQPLDARTGTDGKFKGLPVYTLYLESTGDPDYKLLLSLPAYNTLKAIPLMPKINKGSSGTTTCPNDVGGVAQGDELINEKNEEMMETFKKQLEENLGQKTDGQSNQGFTFVVCEGRSSEAYFDYDQAKWIDDSPPCYSYRDPVNGSTLKSKREYPRFIEIPSYSPNAPVNTDFSQYVGVNLESHLVQDCVLPKTNESLNITMESSTNFHSVRVISERIDEEQQQIIQVMECRTCKAIVEQGGIIPYRMAFDQCDVDGKAINDFSQAVLDAEIAYEKSYPTKDVYGDPVPTAWGLYANSEHDGKKMLENPDINITIG